MIPSLLRAEKRFIVWRHSDDGKKLPHDPKNPRGRAIDSTDERLWVDFETASKVVEAGGVDGLGFALGDGWAGIDLDDVRDPATGQLTAEAQAIVDALDTYWEVSPSGTGIKGFVKAWPAKNHTRAGLEVYGHSRYFTVTGLHLANTPDEPQSRADEVKALIDREFPSTNTRASSFVVPASSAQPAEIPGGTRNHQLFRLSCSMRRKGFDDDAIIAALLIENEKKCKPPVSRQEIERLVRSSLRYEPAPETEQDSDPTWSRDPETACRALNDTFTYIEGGGVMSMTVDDIGRRLPKFRPTAKFREYFNNRQVLLRIEQKKDAAVEITEPLGSFWLSWKHRHSAIGVGFYQPNHVPRGYVNLWRGHHVQPVPGDCSRFSDFVKSVICAGNTNTFNYVERWIARLLQRPWEPAETTLVLIGEEGTGKNVFGRAIAELILDHYFYADDIEDLVARFNEHLLGCVYMFADEITAHNRRAVEKLKAKITSPELKIEAKFGPKTQGKNLLHVIMATNDPEPFPMGGKSRRWVVLPVSELRREDFAYFTEITSWLRSGGYGHLLDHYLSVDLTGWNHREIPITDATRGIRLSSMPVRLQWFRAWLAERWQDRDTTNVDQEIVITKGNLRKHYTDYLDAIKDNGPRLDEARMTIFLRSEIGLRAEQVIDARSTKGHRERTYILPTLEEMVQCFAAKTGTEPVSQVTHQEAA